MNQTTWIANFCGMRFAMLAQPEVAMDQYSNGKIVVGEGVTDSNDTSTACVFRKDWILPRKDFVPRERFSFSRSNTNHGERADNCFTLANEH